MFYRNEENGSINTGTANEDDQRNDEDTSTLKAKVCVLSDETIYMMSFSWMSPSHPPLIIILNFRSTKVI